MLFNIFLNTFDIWEWKNDRSKILIVEDEIIIAIDLKIRLEKLGYHVLGIALNGEDAIKKTVEKNPDLILMNLKLKGQLNGIETAQQIQNQYNIPIIYKTGTSNDNLEIERITEPSCYISKIFDDDEIKNYVETTLLNKKH